jgi:hypothetical protein
MSSVKIDLDEMRKLSGLGPQFPEWHHAQPAGAPAVTTEARRRVEDDPEEYDSPWDRDVAQVKKFFQATDKKALEAALKRVFKTALEFRAAVGEMLKITRAIPREDFDTLHRAGSRWSGLLPAIEFFAGRVEYLGTYARQGEEAWGELLHYVKD